MLINGQRNLIGQMLYITGITGHCLPNTLNSPADSHTSLRQFTKSWCVSIDGFIFFLIDQNLIIYWSVLPRHSDINVQCYGPNVKTSRKSVRVLGGWVNAWVLYSGQQEAKESAPSVPLGRTVLAVAVWLLLFQAHCNNGFILREYRVSTRKQDMNRKWTGCVKQHMWTEYDMHLKTGWTSLAVRLVGQKREDRPAEQKRVC